MSHGRRNALGASGLAVASIAAIIALTFQTREACTTEFNATAYRADPAAVARVVGCDDRTFADRLLGSPLIAANGLDRRFSGDTFERAVRNLVAGNERTNDAAEGFVVMLVASEVGRPAEPPWLGAPFLDLYQGKHGVGDGPLFELLDRIDRGTIADGPGLPDKLRGKLIHSDYPVRVSVIAPADAARFAAALETWDGDADEAAVEAATSTDEYVDVEVAVENAEDLADYRDDLLRWLRETRTDADTLFVFYEAF